MPNPLDTPSRPKRKGLGEHTHFCLYCRQSKVCRRVACKLIAMVPCSACARERGIRGVPAWDRPA
jgi:hypothetical protein